MNQKILLILIVLLIPYKGFCQDYHPLLKNYSPFVYNGDNQIWSIVQDKKGVIYFGATDGLIEYNSLNWTKYSITDLKKPVLSAVIDDKSTIYIGSENEFGYMEEKPDGSLKFISFLNEIDSADKHLGAFWSTAKFQNNIYFVSENYIFRYNQNLNPRIKKIYSYPSLFLAYSTKSGVYVSILKKGIYKIIEDKLIPVPGTKGILPWFILPYENDKYLIGTSQDKLAIFCPLQTDSNLVIQTETFFNSNELKKTNKFLTDNQLYIGAQKIDDERFAIGTISNGIIIINKKAKIIEHFNKKNGLESSTIHYIFKDLQNELWLGTSFGISALKINSGFRTINEVHGIEGVIYDMVRFKNTIFILTNLGMYSSSNGYFKAVDEFSGNKSVQVYFPYIFKNKEENDSLLLVTTTYGLYNIVNKHAFLINNITSDFLFQSEYYKNKLYLFDQSNFYSITNKHKEFSKPDTIFKFNKSISSAIEKNKEELWLIYDKKPHLFNLKTKKITDFEFPADIKPVSFNSVIEKQKKILFLTDKGIYFFNHENKFKQLNEFNDSIFISKKTKQLLSVSDNFFWSLITNDKQSTIIQTKSNNKQFKSDSIPFKIISGTELIFPDGDSLLWAVTSKEIYKYNVNNNKTYIEKASTVLNKIRIKNDSIILNGTHNPFSNFNSDLNNKKNTRLELNYSENEIYFEYALPSFDNEEKNEYSYVLIGGKNKNWSDWTNENSKEYTNLYEGKYIFKVKGRNIYGFESQPAIFEFRILPPWYRTWWAYIIYILLLSVFILLLIKINARRLQKENIRLDKIVRDRTAEISMQKEEIQTQADNLEQINTQLKQRNEEISSIAENLIIANRNINDKNTYITDSINYAQRIQNAVLPSENDISEIFNDFFIIYKPKDIVGGDFYFFKKIRNHIIVAAADSTGHGVPGGFLSMMGMSFLNEIIHENNIQSPNSALDNLRNRVKYSLHQNDYLEGRTDGIDIALCVIDTNTSIMEYSGANIPVIIIRNNELIELKPNMQPVGIHYNERPFDLKKIQLYKDDMIYLFSDGFYDQFGGKHNKKLLISNLKKLLIKNSQHPLKVQKRNISKVFNSWKGDKKQIDDIMLIGIKF